MNGGARFFWAAVIFEGTLGIIGVLVARFFSVDIEEHVAWVPKDLLLGALAAMPMLAAFALSMRRPLAPLAELRELVYRVARPLFGAWSVPELCVVFAVTGIGEEVLFRGALQNALAAYLEPWAAISIAALLFGALHAVTVQYAIWATVFGAYLGWLFVESENLLIPIAAHALYDFLAALFLRLPPPPDLLKPLEED